MEAIYSYRPKVVRPIKTVLIITIITVSVGLLWYFNNTIQDSEKEDE
jgi:hypothetical protein